MKLYTKQGDGGYSSVANGERLKKSERVFHILGTIDELSCFLGLAKCECEKAELKELIESVQKDLMRLMSHIASNGDERYALKDEDIKFLEEKTDYFCSLKEKKGFSFVLPGGSKCSSALNLARCAARKAERLMAEEGGGYKISPENLKYINRFSDFLFAAALYADI